MLSDSNPRYLTDVDGTLYFSAYDTVNGTELWRINSAGIAEIVEDSVPGGGISQFSSFPNSLTNVNGTLYFSAEDGNGRELWRINSSGIAEIVEDNVAGGGIRAGAGSSDPRYLTNVNGTLYFSADDGVNGRQLWRTDNSVAPTILGSISAPIDPQAVNTMVNTSAAFIDLDAGETYTAHWDWGDGNTSAGTIMGPTASTPGNVNGSHSYAKPGVYQITLSISDGHHAATTVFQYVVVYDPSGGFVTGGGWINSPAGAYVPNPTITSKAHFGFVAKYEKGAVVPSGSTEFQFKAADFKFASTSYDWLVVSGAKARFRGAGTINGISGYEFELTAWDGQAGSGSDVDKFRIKIWSQNQGIGVVYDNMLGAQDGDIPTTALGGGNITIHNDKKSSLQSSTSSFALQDPSLNHLQLAGAHADVSANKAVSGTDRNGSTSTENLQMDFGGVSLRKTSEVYAYLGANRELSGHGELISKTNRNSNSGKLTMTQSYPMGLECDPEYEEIIDSLYAGFERDSSLAENDPLGQKLIRW